MDDDPTIDNFVEMGLDPCLLQAISDLGWSTPTAVQASIIPLALQGKNITGRARTGCGKTAAYAIPVIHRILQAKEMASSQETSTLVIAPSRELCAQAERNVRELTKHCARDVRCLDVTGHTKSDIYKPLLAEQPDIVIGTPARLLGHLRAGDLDVKESLRMLIVDEADLVFGYGYEHDTRELRAFLPNAYQAILMSATLMDVKKLRKALLGATQWMSVDLPEEPLLPSGSQLTQYTIECSEEDKFVLSCVLFKLRLLRGKTIIFTNSTDRCYRLKLFLEQFAISAVVLNAELPVSSRLHAVSQFNGGVYNILIASDDKALAGKGSRRRHDGEDKEFGVSRGVDFHHVSNVVNFDFPAEPLAYVHRVGRTARADQRGTALSLLSDEERPKAKEIEKLLSVNGQDVFKPFQFKMEEVEPFRYRARDAMKAVSKVAVRDARKREIKAELMNSTKLKGYFEDHATDLKALRHERQLLSNKSRSLELSNVPDYAIPATLRRMMGVEVMGKRRRKSAGRSGKAQKRRVDPLFKFEAALAHKKKRKRKEK